MQVARLTIAFRGLGHEKHHQWFSIRFIYLVVTGGKRFNLRTPTQQFWRFHVLHRRPNSSPDKYWGQPKRSERTAPRHNRWWCFCSLELWT